MKSKNKYAKLQATLNQIISDELDSPITLHSIAHQFYAKTQELDKRAADYMLQGQSYRVQRAEKYQRIFSEAQLIAEKLSSYYPTIQDYIPGVKEHFSDNPTMQIKELIKAINEDIYRVENQ